MPRSWTEIADGIRVTLAERYTTSSTVIVDRRAALVVDPALDLSELAALADDVTGGADPVVVAAGIATHAHYDHLLWHPTLGTAPRFCSLGVAQGLSMHREELLRELGPVPPDIAAAFGAVTAIAGTETAAVQPVPWPGRAALLVVHDAHSAGHAAVWFPQDRVLLAGDMLSDIELPLPAETGLADYDRGLDILRPYVEQATIVVPGHGRPSDRPMSRWTADRRYLDELLAGGDPDEPRRAAPGMADIHRANLELARGR